MDCFHILFHSKWRYLFNMMSKKDILDQVDRICSNEDFSSKTLLCKFLRFVVDETLAGRGDQLKGYIIGIEVFGKDKHFDPEQDSLVRIHAGRLRRLLKMYYLEAGKEDSVVIDIPKGSYLAEFNERGGKEKVFGDEEDADKNKSAQPVIEASVAILPFKNLSGDPENDYFAHGLSEELSIELTKYEDLKVISCWYRPESDPDKINDLHARFGANFLIDGSVKMSRQSIKIFVKLIDAFSGEQIWGEKYNRDLSIESLVDIEEDIVEEIARITGSEHGIIIHHLTQKASRTKSGQFDVFNAMLHFYYFEAHISPELTIRTFQFLEKAIQKEPYSGKINAMLSILYGTAWSLDFMDGAEAYQKMTELAERALSLEPENQLIRVINLVILFFQNQKDHFLSEVNKCLSMNIISPMRLGGIGFYLALYGEWEAGKAILDKAMSRNIGFPRYYHGAISLYFYRNNEFGEALEEAVKYDIRGLFWGPMLRAANLGQLNRKKKALEQIRELKKLKPDFEDKAYDLISRYVKEEDLVEKVVEGLRKAGLKISLKPVAP